MDKISYKIDEKIKRAYRESFRGVSDEIYYLIIICTKILRCNEQTIGIEADIDRLYDEFVYFKYYSSKGDDYLLNFFMPLIMVSRNFEGYEETAKSLSEKLCRFYGKENEKYKYIIDVFCYDIIFRNLLAENKNVLDILNKVKEELIGFNPYADNKLDNVKFQMKKIKYIENIHKCIDSIELAEKIPQFETGIVVVDILQFMENEELVKNAGVGKDSGVTSVYNTLMSLYKKGEDENIRKDDSIIEQDSSLKSSQYVEFIEAMAEHLIKIRYGKVNIKKYDAKASPRQFLNREMGEEFIDPILSRVKLCSRDSIRENNENKVVVRLLAKTGEYKFEYRIKE